MRRLGLRLLLATALLTLLTLGLGLLLKDQCTGPGGFADGHQYKSLCYNDLQPLYYGRGLDNDTLPYVAYGAQDDPNHNNTDLTQRRGFLEYPVLTGLFMWSAARLGTWSSDLAGDAETDTDFLYWNAFLLALCALGTALLLATFAPEPHRVLYFATGGPLLLYGFHNWDLLAVFFTVLGLFAYHQARAPSAYVMSGVAFALGADAKLFPILIPPLLGVLLLRRAYDHVGRGPRGFWQALNEARDAWSLAFGTLVGVLAVHYPFWKWGSRSLVLETYRFHMERVPNFETHWYAAGHYGERWGLDWVRELGTKEGVQGVALALFATLYLGLVTLAWLRRLDAAQAAFGAVLLFLILNKIFSVQYAVWVLPFVALVRIPGGWYAGFALADLLVYVNIFPLFLTFPPYTSWEHYPARFDAAYDWVAVTVVLRTLSLVALLAWTIRLGWRARPGPRVPSLIPAPA